MSLVHLGISRNLEAITQIPIQRVRNVYKNSETSFKTYARQNVAS